MKKKGVKFNVILFILMYMNNLYILNKLRRTFTTTLIYNIVTTVFIVIFVTFLYREQMVFHLL